MGERLNYCEETNLYFPELGFHVAQHVSKGDIKAVDCYQVAPSLIELRTLGRLAYSRQITLGNERGEWTADFVNFSDKFYLPNLPKGYTACEFISRPEKIYQKAKGWIAVGGIRTVIALPPSGWVIPDQIGKIYDETTGLPLKTIWDLDKALRQAKDSMYSFFWRAENAEGLRVVNRECERFQGDSFEISIIQSPDFTHENIGVRCVYRT